MTEHTTENARNGHRPVGDQKYDVRGLFRLCECGERWSTEHVLDATAEALGYVPERGYWDGPAVPDGEKPWPLGWEQDPHIDDGHAHRWELVRLHGSALRERVVRCSRCHAPRCGLSMDRDPCMERRHHDGLHITLHGSFEPVGGYLRKEAPDA